MPNYFSGTNCRACGMVRVTPHTTDITRIQLYIGGQLVVDRTIPLDPDNMCSGATAPVAFDSTHFADGTSLEVKVVGYGINRFTGDKAQAQATGSAPVWNRANLYGRNDFEISGAAGQKGIPTVHSALVAMNHTIPLEVTFAGWSAPDFLVQLGHPTVVYVHTHGSADFSPNPPSVCPSSDTFLDSDGDDSNLDAADRVDSRILPFVVQNNRVGLFGSGDSPYNTGSPPIWLAFCDACYTGATNEFADAFLWPFWTVYNTRLCNDQSECGWTISKQSDQTLPCAQAFWNAVSAGYTVHEARIKLYYSYEPDDPTTVPPDPRDLVHVWGDYNTRVHGIYTDGPGAETRWFIPL